MVIFATCANSDHWVGYKGKVEWPIEAWKEDKDDVEEDKEVGVGTTDAC